MTTTQRRLQLPALLEQGHPFRQWKTWPIPGTTFTLTGYSRANDKTFFHIPELKCCIDAGLCEGRQPATIFLTHTHNDHVADIEFMVGRAGGVNLYVPETAKPYVERYIRSRRELNHVAPFRPELASELRLHGVGGGQELSLGKRGAYRVRVFECVHKVPCVGYAFDRRKTRLSPEFAALEAELRAAGRMAEFGKRMGAARKAGETVEEVYYEPMFAFVGDTHASLFERSPWLFEYPVIITECTFLDEAQRERADRVGHTLWSQLRPHVVAHPQTTFVLIHFSLRHSDREVVEFFEREVKEAKGALDNIVAWASPDSLVPQLHQRSP